MTSRWASAAAGKVSGRIHDEWRVATVPPRKVRIAE
jgi:hypothetical protein